MTIPVFDGHNDFLLRLLSRPGRRAEIWKTGDGTGHLDLPRMRVGGFAGGMFAIYIPSPLAEMGPDPDAAMDNPPYDMPLPSPIDHVTAQPIALAMAGHLLALERETPEDFALCRSVAEIEAAMATGRIATVMHMEGAEAIDPDLDALYLFHGMGLRSLGPVWSRPTVFGHGVPFRFPGSPDTGPGLTDAGKRLIRACNALRIVVDVSHLNARGVDDVAALTDRPFVASHSNAHAIAASTRNLTDRQLDLIAERNGLVGLNFATSFLREDGRQNPEMTLDPMMRHLDHLIGRLGEDRVGLGSDFDGAEMPAPIRDAAGLPVLIEAMRSHGFGEALIAKLARENWLAVLRRIWGG